ncbi:hypothetical protein HY491_00760 [Candidatus Woesearchaeota archaeon]|nr:hypothetical protein [Candidatus Woesearchaeota archaeon]
MHRKRGMLITKKAMFFSLTAILIISVVLIVVIIQTSKERGQSKIEATQVHIRALNDFVRNLEERYFQEMVQVSAERAIAALAHYASVKAATGMQPHAGSITLLKDNFKTVFFFGYIQDSAGQPGEFTICAEYAKWLPQTCPYRVQRYRKIDELISQKIMSGFSFFDILNSTEQTFRTLGLRTTNFEAQLQELSQEAPFTVDGSIFFSYDFTEQKNIAAWRGAGSRSFHISLYGMPDPLNPSQLIDESWVVDRGKGFAPSCTLPYTEGAIPCQYTEPSFLSRLLNRQQFEGDLLDVNPNNPEKTNGICQASKGCHLS